MSRALLNGTDGSAAPERSDDGSGVVALATSADLPSVALLDIGLPGIEIEVRLVRERHPAIVP